MKKILIVLLSFSILLGCTESDLENRHENLTSNSSLEATNYIQSSCRGKACHYCGLCRGPHYIVCYNNCTCSTIDGHHTDCIRCGGCIDVRIPETWNKSCYSCQCLFFSQVGDLDCFITAMSYIGKLAGYNLTRPEMEQACLEAKVDYENGVYYDEVGKAMQAVFGGNVYQKPFDEYEMRSRLDDGLVLITNYRVQDGDKYFGHAVVVLGYRGRGDNLHYTCLDPATGEYVYKHWSELEWRKSTGENSINKFLVGISKVSF